MKRPDAVDCSSLGSLAPRNDMEYNDHLYRHPPFTPRQHCQKIIFLCYTICMQKQTHYSPYFEVALGLFIGFSALVIALPLALMQGLISYHFYA
jgi:hypothetical protein